MIIVVIGVMGAGKTTVGGALAARLQWQFLDADDFHSEESWRKLERGEPLNDIDRQPWLARIRAALARIVERGESAVLACSALRQNYRDALVPQNSAPGEVRFVYLDADPAVTAARLSTRTDHRASATLLSTQLAVLEEPEDAVRVSNTASVPRLVQQIVDALKLDRP